MASIDEVTASFAASLALAGRDVLDISRRGSPAQRRNSQSYLLAKPLTKKAVSAPDLFRTFKRVWRIDSKFRVQQRSSLFLFSFDLRRDRNKVLWGGPWYYLNAPMVIQEYDGLASLDSIPMDSLFFWVRVEDIPPLLETKENIEGAALVAGNNPRLDVDLFEDTGNIRVRVSHELCKPFVTKKIIKLSPEITKEVSFFYFNLIGKCSKCNLIFHMDGKCSMAPGSSASSQAGNKENSCAIPASLKQFASPNFSQGALKFTGSQSSPSLLLSKNPFAPKDTPKPSKKPVVIRRPLAPVDDNAGAALPENVVALTSTGPVVEGAELGEQVASAHDEAIKITNEPVVSSFDLVCMQEAIPDRVCEAEVLLSPKQLGSSSQSTESVLVVKQGSGSDLGHSETQQKQDDSTVSDPTISELKVYKAVRKPKRSRVVSESPADASKSNDTPADCPTVAGKKAKPIISFPPSALGMIRGPNGLITKPVSILPEKKKRGRKLGSKNKTPPVTSKVPADEVLKCMLSPKPACPSAKGKEKA